MTKVLKLPLSSATFVDDDILPGIVTELRLYMQRGGKLNQLSKNCGGHPTSTTMGRIAYGDTQFPRLSTMIAIGTALGFTLTMHR